MLENHPRPGPQTDRRRRALLKTGMLMPALMLPACDQQDSGQSSANNFLAPAKTSCSPMSTVETYAHYRDNMPQRNDIRDDRPGVFLHLNVKVVDLNDNCMPVAYADVDIWHSDSNGEYSGYQQSSGQLTNGEHALRGRQVTTPFGRVQFITVIPGWSVDRIDGGLAARVSHVNVKVHVQNRCRLTTECYFPDQLMTHIHKLPSYQGRRQTTVSDNGQNRILARPTRLAEDPVWIKTQNHHAIMQMDVIAQGYRADALLGIKL